jgi:ABC-type nitrate/sulfonate/bicarbonate transport system substrate-binding protein
VTLAEPAARAAVKGLWYTRCPVSTSSSLAIDNGWLDEEFAPDGIKVSSLRAPDARAVRESHFDHSQDNSVRDGGNISPIWTRARGGDTRLIAITWVDEYQAVVARPGAGIETVKDLRGRRLAVPRRVNDQIDYWRAMCLHGYESALATEGLTLKDVDLVDLPIEERYIGSQAASRTGTLWAGGPRARRQQAEAFAFVRSEVDALYTAGAPGAQLTAFLGGVDVIDVGRHPDPAVRVNNQVPIVFTASGSLTRDRPDLVARYLDRLLRAAEWAKSHRAETIRTVANDVGATEEWVEAAYGADFHTRLAPGLSEERIAAVMAQKDFLLRHGFIERDFDVRAWISDTPIAMLRRTR